jgi:eukaryotic-like serine/threonine-protein kinase
MGSVYQATHLQLNVPVALKLVRSGIGELADVEERFLREARAAARVRNEHVAQILDVGCNERAESYIVMEFLEGFDLSEVEVGESLVVSTAVHFMIQVCHGMNVAHERGVVHRDLKPSNLFVTTDARGRPLIKILDFGISKQEGVRAGVITNSGNLMGSPCYVAPEQARDPKSADARSDIWSLGVVFYELLSGELPFDGEEVGQILSHVLVDEPVSLEQMRVAAPAALCALVMRCLCKDPALRPQTMLEFAALLEPFATEPAVAPKRRDSSPLVMLVEAESARPTPSSRRASGPPPPKPRSQDGVTLGSPRRIPAPSIDSGRGEFRHSELVVPSAAADARRRQRVGWVTAALLLCAAFFGFTRSRVVAPATANLGLEPAVVFSRDTLSAQRLPLQTSAAAESEPAATPSIATTGAVLAPSAESASPPVPSAAVQAGTSAGGLLASGSGLPARPATLPYAGSARAEAPASTAAIVVRAKPSASSPRNPLDVEFK